MDFCLLTLLPAFFYLVRRAEITLAWLMNDKAGWGGIKPDQRKQVCEPTAFLPDFVMLLRINCFLPS